jgi:hypothetical protein
MIQQQNEPQDMPVVPAPPPPGNIPVLQKLSSLPFPKSGFPFLGILASVYDHVTAVAGRSRPTGGRQTQDQLSPQNTSGRA